MHVKVKYSNLSLGGWGKKYSNFDEKKMYNHVNKLLIKKYEKLIYPVHGF